MQHLPKILVLISGTGTNLQALIDATQSTPPIIFAQICHVVANLGVKAKPGLERAKRAGIATSVRTLKKYKDKVPTVYADDGVARESYDEDLAKYILHDIERPDLIVCAGWMHILTAAFLAPIKVAGIPIINLHPALPGAFNGAHAIERAYQAFQEGKITKTGVVIHYVIEEVDLGEPIIVKEISMEEGESIEDLETRIHKVEHAAIVEGTNLALEALKRREERGHVHR